MKKSVKIELDEMMKKYHWDNIEDIKWNFIAIYIKLSEDFIWEFKIQLNPKLILKYQNKIIIFKNTTIENNIILRHEILDFS